MLVAVMHDACVGCIACAKCMFVEVIRFTATLLAGSRSPCGVALHTKLSRALAHMISLPRTGGARGGFL